MRGQGGGTRTAVALYDYEADDEDEISFKEGDVIEVTEVDGEWTTGKLADGSEGMFPSNYIKYEDGGGPDEVGEAPEQWP